MKHSIIKKVEIYFAVAFVVLMVLFSNFYYNNKSEDYIKELNTVCSNVSIALTAELNSSGIDNVEEIEKNSSSIENYLDKICRRNNIKYAYIFYPTNGISNLYYPIMCNINGTQSTDDINGKYISKGDTSNDSLNNYDKMIWNKEAEDVYYVLNNEYGDDYTFLSPIYDSQKNVIAIFGIEVEVSTFSKELTEETVIGTVLIIMVFAIIGILLNIILNKLLLKPLVKMSNIMSNYNAGSNDNVKIDINPKKRNELTPIYEAFNTMSDNIKENIEKIETLSAEKAKVNAEIDIASKIQSSILPNKKYESEEYEINATLIPAQSISGDFYDYYKIDEEKMLVVIADVSGKGISAALMMSRAFEQCRAYAKLEYSPKKILSSVNEALAENNKEGYFVTIFLGIYDSKNSTLTYSNAGHNMPYIISNNLIPLDKSRGLVVGLFEGEEYGETIIKLKDNDVLFLYTDGVNETENDKNEFYSTERLEKSLISFDKNNIINEIYNDVKIFSNGANQNDDITMLTLTKKVKISNTLILDANVEEFNKIVSLLGKVTDNEYIGLFDYMNYLVAIEEAFVNICSYAYPNEIGKCEISVEYSNSTITCTLKDNGIPFNPLDFDSDSYSEKQTDILAIGGQGIHLIKQIADKVEYENTNECNILHITKKINNKLEAQ